MNSKQKRWLALLLSTLIVEIIYLGTIYKNEQTIIEANRAETLSSASKLGEMSKQSLDLGETKKQIEMLQSKKEEILNQLPSFESSSKEMTELIRYLSLNDFKDIEIKVLMSEKDEWKELEMIKRSYEIKWVGSYDEIKEFIHKLNQSYQMLEIEKLEIDNEVQNLEEESNWKYYSYYKTHFNEIVKAKLELSLYERRNEEEKEIYQPNLNLLMNSEKVFSRTQKEESLIKIEEQNSFLLYSRTDEGAYQLEAPDGESIQINGKTDVSVYLIIRDDGYHMSLMNDEGEVEEISGDIEIFKPQMKVLNTSTHTGMDEIHILITIHNQTQDEMSICIDEEIAENIQVFDEQGKEIRRGYSSGKLKLIK